MMYDEAIMTESFEAATKSYLACAKLDAMPVGFDPTIILTIIAAVLQVCQRTPAQIKAEGQPTRGERIVVLSATRRAFREEYGPFGYARFNGEAAAEAVFEMRKNSSVEQIAAFMACNC